LARRHPAVLSRPATSSRLPGRVWHEPDWPIAQARFGRAFEIRRGRRGETEPGPRSVTPGTRRPDPADPLRREASRRDDHLPCNDGRTGRDAGGDLGQEVLLR